MTRTKRRRRRDPIDHAMELVLRLTGADSLRCRRFVEPGWVVSLAVQYTPDINMILALDIKHQVWISLCRPAAESWQIEFVDVPSRAAAGLAHDVPTGALQRTDKPPRDLFSRPPQVAVDGLLHIPIGQGTPDDRLVFHLFARRRMVSRRPLKCFPSAAPAGSEAAPSSSSSRKCVRS